MVTRLPDPESDDDKQFEEKPPAPTPMEPIDLIKAIGSMVITAILTLVVVWVLVFAATRGDAIGVTVLIATTLLLLGYAWLRRKLR